MMDERNDAAQEAGDALERALLKATQSVERELTRIVKTGEDDLDCLARRIAETLAQLALDGVLGGSDGRAAQEASTGSSLSSFNQIAAALAKAARRGMRFT